MESPWSTLPSVSGLSLAAREGRNDRSAEMTCVTLTTEGFGRPASLAGTKTMGPGITGERGGSAACGSGLL